MARQSRREIEIADRMRRIYSEGIHEHPLRMIQKIGGILSEAYEGGTSMKTNSISWGLAPATASAYRKAAEKYTSAEWDQFVRWNMDAFPILQACGVHDKRARFKFIKRFFQGKFANRDSFVKAVSDHNQHAYQTALKLYRQRRGPKPDGRAGANRARGLKRKRREPTKIESIDSTLIRNEIINLLERARVIGKLETKEHRSILARTAVLVAAARGGQLIGERSHAKLVREFRYAGRQLSADDHAGSVLSHCLTVVVSEIFGAGALHVA